MYTIVWDTLQLSVINFYILLVHEQTKEEDKEFTM